MYTTYNPQNVVATARFLFHKKNLYYSFYTSSRIGRPRAIQFVDDAGVILEEHQLETTLAGTLSVYQNATGKICGVWRRVPRDYKRILRDDRLHVVLLWGNKQQSELALAGKVAKYTALQTELFSSLLEAAPQTLPDGKTDPQLAGAGGTAIVSTSSGAASSMHLTLVFNGVFGAEEFADAALSVKIELPERKEVIFDEIPRVRKPSAEINVLELSSPISIQNLRLMSRGKLLLTVESKKHPHLRIQGHIVVVVFVRTKTHLSWLTVSRREKKIKKRKETYKKKERKFHSSASAIQGQRCLRLRSEDTNKPQECRATN